MKVIWSPLALHRLQEIVEYISQDRPRAAAKWARGVFERVEQLERFPKSGRIVPEIRRRSIRELGYGNHRIIYRVTDDALLVLTIRHCRQLLEEDDLQDTGPDG